MEIPFEDAAGDYYDSDYPESPDQCVGTKRMSYDVSRYLSIATDASRIIDLCCGTGRITLPLARAGHHVAAVDISPRMLNQLQDKLRLASDLAPRIRLYQQDASILSLPEREFDLAVCGFNGLLCIPTAKGQQATLSAVASHLKLGGRLVADVINPYLLSPMGEQNFAHIRSINILTKRQYSRFARLGPYQEDQSQVLSGWYDEEVFDGTIKRRWFSVTWRPIYRFELELMLGNAGFSVEAIESGHGGESFIPTSSNMLVRAVRVR